MLAGELMTGTAVPTWGYLVALFGMVSAIAFRAWAAGRRKGAEETTASALELVVKGHEDKHAIEDPKAKARHVALAARVEAVREEFELGIETLRSASISARGEISERVGVLEQDKRDAIQERALRKKIREEENEQSSAALSRTRPGYVR